MEKIMIITTLLLFLLLIMIGGIFWYYFVGWKRKYPLTLPEYLNQYPEAKTKSGIACGTCGSKSLRNIGAANAADSRRLVSCNSCSSPLYHAKQ